MARPDLRANHAILLRQLRWSAGRCFQLQNAVSFSSARTTKRFPLSRCAPAIQIVGPLESIAETQPQLHPALLRLSAMISQYFTRRLCAFTIQQAIVIEDARATRAISKSPEVFIRIMQCHRRPNCDSESVLQKGASIRMIYLSIARVRHGRDRSPEKPKALALTIDALDRQRSNAM